MLKETSKRSLTRCRKRTVDESATGHMLNITPELNAEMSEGQVSRPVLPTVILAEM